MAKIGIGERLKIDDQTGFFSPVEYRDEYVAGDWLVPVGVASPDLQNVTLGGVTTRLWGFDGNATEERISNSFEIQHDIDIEALNNETVQIEWHTHFLPSGNLTGDVKWFLDYSILKNEEAPTTETPIHCIKTVPLNSQYVHLICGAFIPKPTAGWGIGDIIIFNLRRTPDDVQDTYEEEVLLIKTALHVPVNSNGSRQIYIK
jgi:hypothetical protein